MKGKFNSIELTRSRADGRTRFKTEITGECTIEEWNQIKAAFENQNDAVMNVNWTENPWAVEIEIRKGS
jgi:hypothetical protein